MNSKTIVLLHSAKPFEDSQLLGKIRREFRLVYGFMQKSKMHQSFIIDFSGEW
jgi:hypothetical protein